MYVVIIYFSLFLYRTVLEENESTSKTGKPKKERNTRQLLTRLDSFLFVRNSLSRHLSTYLC